MNSGVNTAILAVVLLLAGLPALAQSWAGHGRIQGVVTDSQNKPVEGAKITLLKGEGDAAKGPKPIFTDKAGRWSFLGLAGGQWRILIDKDGYVPSEGRSNIVESSFDVPQPIRVQLREFTKEQAEAQAKAQAQKNGPSGAEIKGWIEEGNRLLQEQKYADARAQYQKALEKLEAANQAPVLRGVAVTYYGEKNLPQAIDTLKQTLTLTPEDPQVVQLLVSWLVEAGREDEAKTYMAKLPQGMTVDPNSLLNVGIKTYNEGIKGKNPKKFDDAIGYFDQVVKDHPENADAYYYRGMVYLAQNKTAQAKADFQKLLEIAPNHPHAAEVKEYVKSL
ncbi:MAG TPA: tetratricopeptide repeat protein [Thermoanaerobaculia bacterium]|nr:tetratricopeptide repeat protein [Thermoanaerobaculia bacterium]